MRPLLSFLALTYVVSWSLWAAAAAVSPANAPGSTLPGGLLFLLGTIAPSLVALAITWRHERRDGVRRLLRQLTVLPTAARWYLFAVLYMAAAKLAVALLHRVVAGAWPPFGETPVYLMALAIIVSTPVQAGEEIGWRGYALPRLAARMSLARASIVLGIIWSCWHLPFFLIAGSDNFGQSFPMYLLAVTAISVAMAWLYWRTNGSLLLVMLMHAAINNTAGILRSPPVAANSFTMTPSLIAWLTAAVLWLGAAYFLVSMRHATIRASWPPTV
jgi:uncharacterized protein